MTQALSINNIYKSFGKKLILNDISFQVSQGEVLGFVGLNGSGKTTLIKIILDLIKADQGNIKIFNNHNTLYQARKKLCYLPEKFSPSSYLKGIEFLNIALEHYNKTFDYKQLEEFSAIINLNKKILHSRISSYSKGMVQKLGLLSVFMVNPSLLILDEPMSGLDPQARKELKALFTAYVQDNKALFFSSHILDEIEEICNKIVVIHNAKIIFFGYIKQFIDEYKENNLNNAFLKAIQ